VRFNPGERESYSAFPLLWQHTTRAWLRGWSQTSLCIVGWSLIDYGFYGGQHVRLTNCLYFMLMICQPACWEFWGLGIESRSFLRCCTFIFSGGSKIVSCLQSVATLGNQSNHVLNEVQTHLAGHLCWFKNWIHQYSCMM
jgi:hypothetical protein